MYKLCYYRFGEVHTDARRPSGYDRVRQVEIGNKDIEFKYLEEAYTSENWLVRIYKLKHPPNRTHLFPEIQKFKEQKKKKSQNRMVKLNTLTGKQKEVSASS